MIVLATSNILMHILLTTLGVLRLSKIVFACMKRIMEYCGSIKIGGQDRPKYDAQEGLRFHLYVLWLTMSMVFSGTSTR